MDQRLKLQWLMALTSGAYKQGQYELRNGNDEYCCLGVLCDVSGKGEWKQDWGHWRFRLRPNYSSVGGVLPTPLREQVGITDAQETVLINMNDNGKSFAYIAKWIARNL